MRLFSQEQRGIYINLRQNWQCLRGYSPGRQFWRHFVYIWLLKRNKLCLFDLVLAERALDVTLSAQKRRARVPNDLKSGVETPSSGSRADWSRFGVAQVDLFASPETAHCQWFYSLSKSRSARMQWHTAGPRACANMHSPSEPTSTNTVQNQGGWGASPVRGSILAQQDPLPGTHAPRDRPSLAYSFKEGYTFSETGHPLAPTPWMGCGGSMWPIPEGSSHYHFTMSTVHKTDLCAEVEPVRRMVFLSQWGPPEMFDQSRAVLPAAKVGA